MSNALQASVVGTWDFKWSPGTEVRLAFQRPSHISEADFEAARATILSMAELWLQETEGQKPKISLLDSGLIFDTPSPAQFGRQNQTQIARTSPREYEVLVSLERLPLQRIDPLLELAYPGRRDAYAERIHHPRSELGKYSLRVDLGAPCVYLGPFGWHEGTLASYYQRPLSRYMVLHELGHVLGLPHEHQSPRLRGCRSLRYKSEGQIFEIATTRLGLQVAYDERDQEFVRSEITRPWPGPVQFSDWREYGVGDRLDSVMSYPFHDCLLEDNGHSNCQPHGCSVAQQTLERYQTPTMSDRRHLLAMYGPRDSVAGTC